MSTAALGEVADFINGFAFRPSDWHDEGLPIVRIQNLTDSAKPINRTLRQVPGKFHVHRGDLLVSWSATLGVFTWTRTEEALVNQHIFRVVPSDRIDSSFLRHMLGGALTAMQRHLHGATMQHVNRSEFLNTEIPLPPRSEQRRITAILDHADSLRSRRRAAIAGLRELAPSLHRELMAGASTDHVEFGEIVTAVSTGSSPTCEARPAEGGEWAVLKLGAATYGDYRPHENKAYLGDVSAIRRNEVQSGDLLMTRKNTLDLVGAVVVAENTPPRMLFPDLIFRLEVDRSRVEPQFLQSHMMAPATRRAVRALAGGSAASMSNISGARLRSLTIALPSIEAQRRFVSRKAAVTRSLRDAERDAQRLDELFASLQSRAFRGEL